MKNCFIVFLLSLLALVSSTNFVDEGAGLGGVKASASQLGFSSSSTVQSLTVTSGEKWTIQTPDWLRVSQISGRGYSWSVSLTSEENYGYNRTGVITLQSPSSSAKVNVSQQGRLGAYVPVSSVSLSPQDLVITEGETRQLTATVYPSNASNKTVTWESNATGVATVSSTGLITAKAEGSATITVTTEDGSYTATCRVTVNKKVISVTGVSVSPTSLTLTEGDTYQLAATVSPSNATNKNVRWQSNSTGVATVSSTGLITAKVEGSATITVTTEDSGYTASCYVTVRKRTIPVTGVSVSPTSVTLTEGNTYQLSATVSPSNATNKTVRWTSNATSVATVSSNGLITAKAQGSATITVTTEDGGYTATCRVTVNPSQSPTTGTINGHEWVDLGLPSGLKWATFNVGASSPSDYGNYYAWGETSPKSKYDWSTYRYCNGTEYSLTKYNTNSSYGTVDNKTRLEMTDDAARANWGGSWRMPTYAEWTELMNNCNWTWTTQGGRNGYKVTSWRNGNSIFLPAAGYRSAGSLSGAGSYGYYWSSSLASGYPTYALDVYFSSGGVPRSSGGRCNGRSVRPVSE